MERGFFRLLAVEEVVGPADVIAAVLVEVEQAVIAEERDGEMNAVGLFKGVFMEVEARSNGGGGGIITIFG